jgi:hypothetical protein
MAGQDTMDETLLDLGEHITGELSELGVAFSIDHDELNVTVDARAHHRRAALSCAMIRAAGSSASSTFAVSTIRRARSVSTWSTTC